MKHLAMLLSILLIAACSRTVITYRTGTIKAIGACNTSALCGVLLEDGTKCFARYPVLSEVVNCKIETTQP